jgi:hypothetical protein
MVDIPGGVRSSEKVIRRAHAFECDQRLEDELGADLKLTRGSAVTYGEAG